MIPRMVIRQLKSNRFKNISNTWVLIVTHNDVNQIDKTMGSLYKQTVPRETLYINIVDYASTDGTYEKLLGYDPYHLGVYRVTENISPGRRLADAQRFFRFGAFGTSRSFTLRPGDTVVPDFVEYCSNMLAVNWKLFPSQIIGEADIQKDDGIIAKQQPLFKKPFLLNGQANAYEYLTRGYKHKVMHFGTTGQSGRRYSIEVFNDRHGWNRLYYESKDRKVIYTNKTLASLRDEEDFSFKSILWLYACLISDFRYYEIYFEQRLKSDMVDLSYKNLAHDALWKSYNNLLLENKKEAENCLLLSGVIYPAVISTPLYLSIKRIIDSEGIDDKEEIMNIGNMFDEEDTHTPPKNVKGLKVKANL
jgi:hypothetical protein